MKLPGGTVRGWKKTALGACLLCGFALSGCRHKPQLAPLPPVLSPVDLVEVPPIENPPMIEVPQTKLPPVPSASAATRPGRRRRPAPPKTASTPVPVPTPAQQTASAEPPADIAAIGALTTGGETSPQTKQEASELISSIEKRLNALPMKTAEDEKTQINKVKNFLRDAQEAWKTGDAEGAKTLATKAKLLLDDLEK